jgi:hypothetical protein
MGCEFIYAIVPKKAVASLLREKALAKAADIIRNADLQMTLEDQRVTGSIKARIARLADQLVASGDVW